jgi:hypothetical protein
VLLGGSEDPAGFGPTVRVARNSALEYAVSSSTFRGEIFIYARDGALARVLGRRGQGPGEFRRELLLAFDNADSLHAIERGSNRYTVLSPDFQVARTAQLSGQVIDFCLESTGTLFTLIPISAPEGISFAHVIARDGQTLSSFATIEAQKLDPLRMPQLVACTPHGARLLSAGASYLIDQYSADGASRQTLQAARRWFPTPAPAGRDRTESRTVGPSRSVQTSGLSADREGRIWLFVVVPGDPQEANPTTTTVEVIDPARGILLARGSLAGEARPLDANTVYALVEDAIGDRRIQISRLLLVGTP